MMTMVIKLKRMKKREDKKKQRGPWVDNVGVGVFFLEYPKLILILFQSDSSLDVISLISFVDGVALSPLGLTRRQRELIEELSWVEENKRIVLSASSTWECIEKMERTPRPPVRILLLFQNTSCFASPFSLESSQTLETLSFPNALPFRMLWYILRIVPDCHLYEEIRTRVHSRESEEREREKSFELFPLVLLPIQDCFSECYFILDFA